MSAKWQTETVTKDSRNDYLILIASIVLLLAGWGLNLIWAYAASALLGFALSLALVVAAIRHREFGSDALALLAIIGSVAIGEWPAKLANRSVQRPCLNVTSLAFRARPSAMTWQFSKKKS